MKIGGNMVLDVVSISNGKGICFPNSVINALGIKDRIMLKTRKNDLVITPVNKIVPRKNWRKAFEKMNKNKEDNLYFADNNVDFEWEWQ